MHYTAMAGVSFMGVSNAPDLSHAVSISSIGVIGISIVPVMMFVVVILTSVADRLRKQRALLDELFEQAPQAVALSAPMTALSGSIRSSPGFSATRGKRPSEVASAI
jgi:hypothetical protein